MHIMVVLRIGWVLLVSMMMANAANHAKIHTLKPHAGTNHVDAHNNDYIGMGYDAVFGNPFGSTGSNGDSGYRNAIIQTPVVTAGHAKGKQTSEGRVWARDLSTCWHTDQREDMDNNDILKDLQNEFQMEGSETNEVLQANILHGFNGDNTHVKSAKYRLTNSFCAVKESGIVLPFKGQLSAFFVKDAEKLPPTVKGLDKCTPDVYLVEPMKPCCADIDKWVRFFRRYGTHVTTHIVTGGHIIYVDRIVSAHNLTKNKKTLGMADDGSTTKKAFGRNLEGSRQSRQMWIIGGFYVKGLELNNLRAFKKWSQNVRKRPMPIRGNFSSLEHFLGNSSQAYHPALQFYRNLQSVANGHSLNYKTFTQMLKETVTVASNTAIVHCPIDMVVVAGFVISGTLPMQIDSCIPSRTFCSSDVLQNNAVSLALCAKGGSFKITTIESNTRRPCPGDLVVAAGFQLYMDASSGLQIASCPPGLKDCGDMPGSGGVEWKMCVPRIHIDPLMSVHTGLALPLQTRNITCSASKKVISGFTLLRTVDGIIIFSCLTRINDCSIHCAKFSCLEGLSYMICT